MYTTFLVLIYLMKVKLLMSLNCVQLLVTPWTVATRLLCPWNSLGKNTVVGCHFLLHRIFPTQGLNPCLLLLLHYRWILPMHHLGSPNSVREW